MQPHTNIMTNPNRTNNKNKSTIDDKKNNNIIIHQPSRTHSSTTQACAACKYQRRKCTPDCVLAPYFPHDRQRQFLNAHRLFGVSNIVKIVKNLQLAAKDQAMRTIIFQSDARAADPVGGCYRIIHDLEQRISLAKAELDIVLHHLALCRATHQQQVVHVGPSTDAEDANLHNWESLEQSYNNNNNEKWTGEDEILEVDDVNSWGRMHDENNVNVESTTSSLFPRKRHIEEHVHSNHDHLSYDHSDDVRRKVHV